MAIADRFCGDSRPCLSETWLARHERYLVSSLVLYSDPYAENLRLSSTIVDNRHELGDGCRTIQALVEGSSGQIPQVFIEEEIAKLLAKTKLLYATDAPELLWILRREKNQNQNQLT